MSFKSNVTSAFESVKSGAKTAWKFAKALIAAGVIPSEQFGHLEKIGLEMLSKGVYLDGYSAFAMYPKNGQSLILFPQSMSIPRPGMNFSVPREMGWTIIAGASDLEAINITYIDSPDLDLTKAINKIYEDQFGEDGLLKFNYASTHVFMYEFANQMNDQGLRITEYMRCAITRPYSSQATQTEGLKFFTFTVVYQDYKVPTV